MKFDPLYGHNDGVNCLTLHQGAMIIQFDYGTFGQWVV